MWGIPLFNSIIYVQSGQASGPDKVEQGSLFFGSVKDLPIFSVQVVIEVEESCND